MIDESKRLIGHAYAITFDLGNGRQMQVNGSLYTDDSPAAANAKLDTIMGIMERQRARAEIETLEWKAKARHKRVDEINIHIASVQAQIAAIEGKSQRRPGDPNQVKQLEAALENHKLNLKRMEPEIAEGERAVAEAKVKAA